MPKYTLTVPAHFCDYCDVYLTHDSMSVRKAHNSGRNHIRNVVDYYTQIGQERQQSVIDDITKANADAGTTPEYMQIVTGPAPSMYPPGGVGMPPGMIPPPPGAFPGPPGAAGRGIPPFPPHGVPFPPGPFPGGPPGQGLPFPPPGMPPFQPPPNMPFPPHGMNGQHQGPPGGYGPPGQDPRRQHDGR